MMHELQCAGWRCRLLPTSSTELIAPQLCDVHGTCSKHCFPCQEVSHTASLASQGNDCSSSDQMHGSMLQVCCHPQWSTLVHNSITCHVIQCPSLHGVTSFAIRTHTTPSHAPHASQVLLLCWSIRRWSGAVLQSAGEWAAARRGPLRPLLDPVHAVPACCADLPILQGHQWLLPAHLSSPLSGQYHCTSHSAGACLLPCHN